MPIFYRQGRIFLLMQVFRLQFITGAIALKMQFCLIRSILWAEYHFLHLKYLSNSGRTVFDIGAGFLFISGKFSGGFSINHLAEPDLSDSRISDEKLKRKLLVHLSGNFILSKTQNLKIRPLGFLELQGGFLSGGIGTVLESNYLSVNAILLDDNGKNLNIQTGFSFKAGKITFLLQLSV